MKNILIVFGTRPESIKMIPVIKELEKHPDQIKLSICVSAQHREMLDQVLKIFDISPDFDFNIMKPGQDLYDVTCSVLDNMKLLLQDIKPDLILVHGDTTTSMAVALAAFYQQIPVGHVEAGLRTNNIYSPWPEEINRQITGRIAAYHFAPTETAKKNLLSEQIDPSKIFVVGNTVIDALFIGLDQISNSNAEQAIVVDLIGKGYSYKPDTKIILITGHRRENFGQGFIDMCEAIGELADKYPRCDFIYPVHPNPNVLSVVKDLLNNRKNVLLIEPLEYLSFLYLMNKSYLIITDSGGIQEEAPGLGKPVLVTRDTTERPEAVVAGTVKLVGTDKEKIIKEVTRLIEDQEYYDSMARALNPYGDGTAAKQITNIILNNL